jgi:hypothetical protein
VSLLNGDEVYICLMDYVEVIPGEIDLTPGYGQTAPYTNTVCPNTKSSDTTDNL